MSPEDGKIPKAVAESYFRAGEEPPPTPQSAINRLRKEELRKDLIGKLTDKARAAVDKFSYYKDGKTRKKPPQR